MAEPVHVRIAVAKVYDDVRLEHTAPKDVDLHAGDELHLRFAYRVYEEHPDEDLWVFRLTAQLEGDEEGVAERRHHDRKMIADDVLSHVGLDLRFPNPGTFAINYGVSASLSRRAWDDKAPHKQVSENSAAGTLTVNVHAK